MYNKQIEIKRSMIQAVSELPRLQAAMGELIKAVEIASKPESEVDEATACECGAALEQFAYALETVAAELRAKSRQFAPLPLASVG